MHRYPRHEQASFLTKALESLEIDIEDTEEDKGKEKANFTQKKKKN